jgi:hypothetical protein
MSRMQFRLSTLFLAITWLSIACVMWPALAWVREIIPGISPTVARYVCGVALLLPIFIFHGYRGVAALLKIRDMDL